MNIENTCCFIGHRTINETEELKNEVCEIIENLILFQKVDTFLFGSKSKFNDLCFDVVSKMKETAINPSEQTVFISHGDCIEDAEFLADLVKKELGVKDVFIHYIEPVIGCHSGPGTLALFFMGTHR